MGVEPDNAAWSYLREFLFPVTPLGFFSRLVSRVLRLASNVEEVWREGVLMSTETEKVLVTGRPLGKRYIIRISAVGPRAEEAKHVCQELDFEV